MSGRSKLEAIERTARSVREQAAKGGVQITQTQAIERVRSAVKKSEKKK